VHRKSFVSGLLLAAIALLAGGFTPGQREHAGSSAIRIQGVQSTPLPDAAPPHPALGTAPAPETQQPEPEPERPLTPEEQKAAEERLKFDRLLVDAAVLLTDFENYKRGKSGTPLSLSAFRSLETQLKAIADADPSNTQALDMSNAMKMAQLEILQPSLEAAAGANRQLYGNAMMEQMAASGMKVRVSGREYRMISFMSPQMTKEMAIDLLQSAKISERARALEFGRVTFTNGRRHWTYDVPRGRFR
jgi:hypothetical protein